MPIEFACEQCSQTLRVPEGSAGKRSQCPACKHIQRIPHQTGSSAPKADNGRTNAAGDDRLSIPCPKCKHLLLCTPDLLGTRGQCKQCQHIFTISLKPEERAATEPVALVFSCPECNQLFEGSEEMRGRKGKCHACQAVFTIALREALTDEVPPSEAAGATRLATDHRTTAPKYAAPKSLPKKPATATSLPRAGLPKPQTPKQKLAKFKLSQPETTNASSLTGSNSPEAAVLSPASLQQRTRRPAGASSGSVEMPIRFMCAQCHGLMEVPGSSAGMDTACPYCQAVQTIPARSSHEHQSPLSAPLEPEPSAFVRDPLGDFGSSPAALQNQWAAQSISRHRSGLTFSNVFQVAFESLFPSSLVTPLHAAILLAYGIVGWLLVMGFLTLVRHSMQLSIGTIVTVNFVSLILFSLVSLTVVAWFSAAVRHNALRAVRKQPFDMAKAFSPGGAYGASLLVALVAYLLNLLVRMPQLLATFWPESLGWWVLAWALITVSVSMAVITLLSLACFAAMDGDSAGEAIGTSSRLVLKHFPVMVAVKLVVWLITIPLAVLTLGFAFVLPIYFNAALYNLARKA